MTDTVIMYGTSDDLIEIEGAVSAEFSDWLTDGTTIEFSDGRRFTFIYDEDACWRVECENPEELGITDYSKIQHCGIDELTPTYPEYSEKVIYRSWDGVDSVELVEGEN